jgi:predicted TIM-barrel fold metal-dependent hydrolase
LCRVSTRAPDYADARTFHEALIAANPNHLVWASDWPHLGMRQDAADVGILLERLTKCVSDDALRRAILVDNPARLYGFSVAG